MLIYKVSKCYLDLKLSFPKKKRLKNNCYTNFFISFLETHLNNPLEQLLLNFLVNK